MESDRSLEFLRVVESAAIQSAHSMGQGDRRGSDRAAVEAMRKELDTVPIDGTIVIGEGERDEAPMLYIGEKVGLAGTPDGKGRLFDEVDIAVDPLEGSGVYTSEDLAKARDIVVAATGVTDGALLEGVRFFGDGIRTSSLITQTTPHRTRFVDAIQVYPGPHVKIRF